MNQTPKKPTPYPGLKPIPPFTWRRGVQEMGEIFAPVCAIYAAFTILSGDRPQLCVWGALWLLCTLMKGMGPHEHH